MASRVRVDLTIVRQAPARKSQDRWGATRGYRCQPEAFGNGWAARSRKSEGNWRAQPFGFSHGARKQRLMWR
jgi:hypothetical protein